MNLTIPELIEKLSVLDEIELLEILEITSVDILNRFEDVVEDKPTEKDNFIEEGGACYFDPATGLRKCE